MTVPKAPTPYPDLASLPSVKALNAVFDAMVPGATMRYWSGDNLAILCEDWKRKPKKPAAGLTRAARARKIRDWAASLHGHKLGYLTQKKFGDKYDYRITKAMEKMKWKTHVSDAR